MARIDRVEFCTTFIPMARTGKSALEIGQALGFEGTNAQISTKVSQKSGGYRKELGEEALRIAANQGLDQEATDALVIASKAKMPKLTSGARTHKVREPKNDFAELLDNLFEQADTPE